MPWLLIILVVAFWFICSRSSVPGKTFLYMLAAMVGVAGLFLLLALLIPSRAEAFGTMAAVAGVFAAIATGVNHLATHRKPRPIMPGKMPKV